jgi:pimeloyl-ACP methyl ester carboxylesterase
MHFILVPGLVPDGPETFLRQANLFLAYGSTSTVTYPYDRFELDEVLAALDRRVDSAFAAGEQPVLVGVSIGGGICLEWLRRRRERGSVAPLAAVVLVSPFTCTSDLAPLLKRLIDPILAAAGDDQARLALERGRDFFKLLASRSVSPSEASGWRWGLTMLTPSGIRAWQERGILRRIERTLDSIPANGAIQRVCSLRDLRGLVGSRGPLTGAPTLILWGSKERQTLSMDGPGTGILCRPDLAYRHLPNVEVHWVYGAGGEEVPHASLLKHAHAFNPHLKRFLRRLRLAPISVSAQSA